MKAEIKEDGFLHITPETPTEGFALKQIISSKNSCSSCYQSSQAVRFDFSVITDSMRLTPQINIKINGISDDLNSPKKTELMTDR